MISTLFLNAFEDYLISSMFSKNIETEKFICDNNYNTVSLSFYMSCAYYIVSSLFTNFAIMLLIVSMWLIIFYEYILFNAINTNSLMLSVSRLLYVFIYNNMIVAFLGNVGRKFAPFFIYLFIFILSSNLLGLVPNIFPLTSQLSVTLFLSSVCRTGILFLGLYTHGIKFFANFYPSKVPFHLSAFLMTIECISYIVRIASLALRLFANIVAGHILLDTIALFYYYINLTVLNAFSLVSTIISVFLLILLFVMLLFETMIAFLQAHIFVVLGIIYTNESIHIHA